MSQCFAYVGHGSPDSGLTCECGKPALRRVTVPPVPRTGKWKTVGFCKEHMPQASALASNLQEAKGRWANDKFKAGEWERKPKWRPRVARDA